MPESVILNTKRLDEIRAGLEPGANAILDLAAFNIQAGAMQKARVDTGAMRASIYVEGASGGAGFGQAASAAQGLRPGVGLAAGRKPAGKLERIVGVAVEYAYWVELRYPFLGPAAVDERPKLAAAFAQLFK